MKEVGALSITHISEFQINHIADDVLGCILS